MDAEDFSGSSDGHIPLTDGVVDIPELGECHGSDLHDFLTEHPDFASRQLEPHAIAAVRPLAHDMVELHVVAKPSTGGSLVRVVFVSREHLEAFSLF